MDQNMQEGRIPFNSLHFQLYFPNLGHRYLQSIGKIMSNLQYIGVHNRLFVICVAVEV